MPRVSNCIGWRCSQCRLLLVSMLPTSSHFLISGAEMGAGETPTGTSCCCFLTPSSDGSPSPLRSRCISRPIKSLGSLLFSSNDIHHLSRHVISSLLYHLLFKQNIACSPQNKGAWPRLMFDPALGSQYFGDPALPPATSSDTQSFFFRFARCRAFKLPSGGDLLQSLPSSPLVACTFCTSSSTVSSPINVIPES